MRVAQRCETSFSELRERLRLSGTRSQLFHRRFQAAAKSKGDDKKATKTAPKPKKERPAHWKEGQKQELTPPFEVGSL